MNGRGQAIHSGQISARYWQIVQERLGHADIAMTLNRYSHVTPDMRRVTTETLDAAFREVSERLPVHRWASAPAWATWSACVWSVHSPHAHRSTLSLQAPRDAERVPGRRLPRCGDVCDPHALVEGDSHDAQTL
jgi:hypothetical protein